MNLNDLVGKKLEKITSHQSTIKRLLAAAQRNIVDSKVMAVSAENRFDSGYKAIMQIANAALQANGFRTLTSRPGHHYTMIQVLPETIGINKETVIILDAMRNNVISLITLVILFLKAPLKNALTKLKNY